MAPDRSTGLMLPRFQMPHHYWMPSELPISLYVGSQLQANQTTPDGLRRCLNSLVPLEILAFLSLSVVALPYISQVEASSGSRGEHSGFRQRGIGSRVGTVARSRFGRIFYLLFARRPKPNRKCGRFRLSALDLYGFLED
jgi:hypothetical protein